LVMESSKKMENLSFNLAMTGNHIPSPSPSLNCAKGRCTERKRRLTWKMRTTKNQALDADPMALALVTTKAQLDIKENENVEVCKSAPAVLLMFFAVRSGGTVWRYCAEQFSVNVDDDEDDRGGKRAVLSGRMYQVILPLPCQC
jgi:hypothetical protein